MKILLNHNDIYSLAKKYFLLIVLILGICGVHLAGLHHFVNEAWIDGYIRGQGLWGYVLFFALASVLTSLPCPRQMVNFLAGYAFGPVMGTVCALLGAMVGCVCTFLWARYGAQGYVQRRYGERIQKVNAFLVQNPFAMAFMMRCVPTGSNFLVNVAAGLSHIPARAFFAGSFLGYIPQTLIFALLGSGLDVAPLWHMGLSAVLFIMSTALFGLLCRRYKLSLKEEEKAV